MTPDLAAVQRRAMALLEQANVARSRFGMHQDHFEVRTAEFLLLVRKLAGVDGLRFGRLLEVGAGWAYSLRLWADVVDEAVGIDVPRAIDGGRRLLAALPPPRASVTLLASTGETLAGVEGDFDLILTQYVLEHVGNIGQTLAALRARLRPGGHVVHVLNSAVDRAGWYMTYRLEHSLLARLRASVATRGWWATARNPLEFTPPHEPCFGDYARELGQYRLEAWALRVLRAGFEIVDHFQTRDVNWVLVTRSLAAEGSRP